MTIDLRSLADHEVLITNGPNRGQRGKVISLSFEIRNDPILEIPVESAIATVLSDTCKFIVPAIWLEVLEED